MISGNEVGIQTKARAVAEVPLRVEPLTKNDFGRSIGENVKLNHCGDCWVMTMVDEDVAPVAEVSSWVLEHMKEVSRVMGMSFESVEEEAWVFLVALEKLRNNSDGKHS